MTIRGSVGRDDRRAVAAVLAAERSLGREPTETPHHHEGYDIGPRASDDRPRFSEVKGKAKGKGKAAGKPIVTVSAGQIRTRANAPGA